jgi:hypothetical protein
VRVGNSKDKDHDRHHYHKSDNLHHNTAISTNPPSIIHPTMCQPSLSPSTQRKSSRLAGVASHSAPLANPKSADDDQDIRAAGVKQHVHVVDNIAFSSGRVYYGGYCALLLHFCLINVGLLSNTGINATGTLTCLSWFVGWCVRWFNEQRQQQSNRVMRVSRALRLGKWCSCRRCLWRAA